MIVSQMPVPLLSLPRLLFGLACVLAAAAAQACDDVMGPSGSGQGESVGYSSGNPVIYDNDSVSESYFDEYFFALASQGVIDLRGAITTNSWYEQYECRPGVTNADVSERAQAIAIARASGMRNIPDVTAGAGMNVQKPSSGVIEDTAPVLSDGAYLIRNQVLAASPALPIVIVAGGQGTSIASAYLLAHRNGQGEQFADRVIVAWGIGTPAGGADYNGFVDPWSVHVIFGRLRVVAYVYEPSAYVSVPKSELTRIPQEPLRQALIDRGHPNGNPGDQEIDIMPAIPLTRSDYVQSSTSIRVEDGQVECIQMGCGRCITSTRFVPGGNGRTIRVTGNGAVATEEWWRWMTDPASYPQSRSPSQGQAPGLLIPFIPAPGRRH
jgi:hypothetical protein